MPMFSRLVLAGTASAAAVVVATGGRPLMSSVPLGPYARRCRCGGLVEDDQHSRCGKCRARGRWHRRKLRRTDTRHPARRRGEPKRP